MSAAWAEAQRKLKTAPAELLFAVLFVPRKQRPALTALLAVYIEIQEILHECSDAGVAHTKLAWWREEVSLLSEQKPRHPLAINLAEYLHRPFGYKELLLEIIEGIETDISPPLFPNYAEVESYCRHRGGALLELVAVLTGAQQATTRAAARDLGTAWQLADIVIQAGERARHGRMYFAVQDLHKHGLEHHLVNGAHTETGLKSLLSDYTLRAQAYAVGATSRAAAEYKTLIAARVLNGLAQMRLKIYAKHGYDMTQPPVELPPFTRLLTAWRSARLTHAA